MCIYLYRFMASVYKFHIINKDNIRDIYVFTGYNHEISRSSDSVIRRITDLEEFFESFEIDFIRENDVNVYQIHDTIQDDYTYKMIYSKINHYISKIYKSTSDGLFIFSLDEHEVKVDSLFESVKKLQTLDEQRSYLITYIQNIYDNDNIKEDILMDESLTQITYQMIKDLNIEGKHTIKVPCGIHYKNSSLYPVNPYDTVELKNISHINIQDIITTRFNECVYTGGSHNNFYVTIANDTREFLDELEVDSLSDEAKTIFKLYYPNLYVQNIFTSDDVERNYEKLHKEDNDFYNKIEKKMISMNLLYTLNSPEHELNYKRKGIQSLSGRIIQDSDKNTPLDYIFKKIHACNSIPMITFNPGRRKLNTYRFHFKDVDRKGKKLPVLTKSTIIKSDKILTKNKTIGFHVRNEDSVLYINLHEDFTLDIFIEPTKQVAFKDIIDFIESSANRVIERVNTIIESNGYVLSSYDQSNFIVDSITTNTVIELNKKLTYKKYENICSSIFNTINASLEENAKGIKGVHLMFKNVSYYNEFDAQKAYIYELLKNKSTTPVILQKLVTNYGISLEEATETYQTFLAQADFIQDGHRRMKIKANPGVPIRIRREPFKKNIIVTIENVDSLSLLPIIEKYLNNVILLTQTTNINYEKQIIDLYNGKKLEDAVFNNSLDKEKSQAESRDEIEETNAQPNVLGMLDFGASDSDSDSDEEESPSSAQRAVELDEISDSEDESGDESDKGGEIEEEGIGIDELDLDDLDMEELGEEDLDGLIGGASPDKESDALSDFKTDMVGTKLKSHNFFYKRLRERDPILFLQKAEGKFNSYSRGCPANVKRQPVILTQEEKEMIDKEYPGSYTNALEYGSTPEKKHWYICPRYWCFATNTPMTKSDIDAGKCGNSTKIIPHDADVVPSDAFAYEFYGGIKEHGTEDKYIEHHPGFLKDGSHPDSDLCVPCCFKSWDKPKQVAARKKCSEKFEKLKKAFEKSQEQGVEDELEEMDKTPEELKQQPSKKQKGDDYIKGVDKFPLDKGRYGYLPLPIQKLLMFKNSTCFISKTNTNIKPFTNCLLRKGVEYHSNQSFLAPIADLYTSLNDGVLMTIESFRKKLSESVSLDEFIGLQNGSLITTFESEGLSVSLESYKDSKVLSALSNINSKKRIISAYENYKNYLLNKDSSIDYTYTWDLICKPNKKLFPHGINLIIMKIPSNDITDNVEVICPSNAYSNTIFDSKKLSLFVIEKDGIFEPVHMYRDNEDGLAIRKVFSEHDKTVMSNIKEFFDIIKKQQSKCAPKPSLPSEYKYKKALNANDTMNALKSKNYEIESQVLQTNGKAVALIAKEPQTTNSIYIPIYPSGVIEDVSIKEINDPTLWVEAKDTIERLKALQRKIPTKPEFIVIEDELCVGVLTETNQFVMFSNPVEKVSLESYKIPFINNNNFVIQNKTIYDSIGTEDTERIENINKIKLEENLYHAYRNTMRILFTSTNNYSWKQQLVELINDIGYTYIEKFSKVSAHLQEFHDKYHEFKEDFDEGLIESIRLCIMHKENINANYCLQKDDSFINIYPEKNLLNGESNSQLYLNRLVDELIRNTFLYNYMTSSNQFLAFGNSTYEIKSDEFILLSSAFEQNYFDNMISHKQANISSITDIDYVVPSKSIAYMKNKVKLFEDKTPEKKSKPQPRDDGISNSSYFEKVAPIKGNLGKINSLSGKMFKSSDFREYEIQNTPASNTSVFTAIINEFTGSVYDVSDIKKELLSWYNNKFIMNELKTLLMLKHQGKQKMIQAVFEGKTTLEDVITSDTYYFTNLDIMALSEIYKIPLVLISTTKLKEQIMYNEAMKKLGKESEPKNDKYWFSEYSNPESNILIIKQFSISANIQTVYSIIKVDNFISNKKDIPEFVRNVFDSNRGKQLDIDTLINSFKPSKVSANKLKKRGSKMNGSPVKKLKKIVIKKKV
jgi:hypothetical protein